MAKVKIGKSAVRQLATGRSYERGEEYYADGWVLGVTMRGEQLQAEVEGSQYDPYIVTVQFKSGVIYDTDCTCPYDWGGVCKHIVAALLAYIDGDFVERPSAADLLGQIDSIQALALLQKVVAVHPETLETIEAHLARQTEDTAVSSPRPHHPLDPQPFRQQTYSLIRSLDRMRGSEAYWQVAGVVQDISKLLQQAWPYIEGGDGRNALVILEAVTDVYVEEWTNLDGSSGETGDFFIELDPIWCEALLTVDLTPAERDNWSDKLTHWQDEIVDYGIEDVLDAAQAAAIQGWDAPLLQQVLRGDYELDGSEPITQTWYAKAITEARLNILARQNRQQEYLNFAAAEAQHAAYASMLVEMGRVDEAVVYGLDKLASAGAALTLAQKLHDSQHSNEAFAIAEHGLTLPDEKIGDRLLLSAWLRDMASQLGNRALATRTAVFAFQHHPTLANYQAIQEIAEAPEWLTLRQHQLDYLNKQDSDRVDEKVDVFLYENKIDEAVTVVQKATYVHYETVRRVAEAAIERHPVWVMTVSKKQAEKVMNAAQSKYYSQALNWLKLTKAAYLASSQQTEWRTYLDDLLRTHSRKRSLVPGLKGLR